MLFNQSTRFFFITSFLLEHLGLAEVFFNQSSGSDCLAGINSPALTMAELCSLNILPSSCALEKSKEWLCSCQAPLYQQREEIFLTSVPLQTLPTRTGFYFPTLCHLHLWKAPKVNISLPNSFFFCLFFWRTAEIQPDLYDWIILIQGYRHLSFADSQSQASYAELCAELLESLRGVNGE